MVNGAENFDRYWSVLTGDQKIPPVTTDARGLVGLKFLDNFSRLVYVVNTENIVIEGFSVPSSLIFPPNTTLNGFISENNYLAKHVFFGFRVMNFRLNFNCPLSKPYFTSINPTSFAIGQT